ncbi:hypothetical protein PKB_4355 [Pseudomonas knackmussii B13]|uniref:Lipoprotein n=1 Tax=Pseudomonas knackmussii (strain DSM 6978 / CCUG 54928 / LMG 23759 / B13) TaxID=1301098 RepID=A0A024HKW5_PSEKB|nr:type VI secretion system-associated protein TagO [Pseudomonas knackmussii]CDF85680.1 hypothetical protein PKB_4355 [Pseudomonas knackmussii B13]
MRAIGFATVALSIVMTAGCFKKELSPEEKAVVSELRGQLSETEGAIAQAKLQDQKLSGGLVKALIEARLEILQTNKALVQQRINAIEAGAPVKEVTVVSKSNPDLANTLSAELETAKAEAAAANAEAQVYGGLVGALKASTAATADQTVAMLKQQYLIAKYGLASPSLPAANNTAALASSGSAQISRPEVEACASTSSNVERSTCYDALAARHGMSPPADSAVGAGKWITTSKKDPLTDETIATAMVPSDSPSRRDAPMLVIRCKSKATEMYISWDNYLGRSAFVTSRVGQEKATTSEWTLSTDSKATFYPGSAIGVAKRLIESESFVASVTPYNESPVTAVFDGKGASEALAEVRKNCGW